MNHHAHEDAAAHAARRAEVTAEIVARTGIDEAMIERLVHGFYDRVRGDPMLGPVFDSKISDWEPHLARMCAFWSSVALLSGRYHGRPMPAHVRLPVDARHFDRWLALFEATARDLCPPAAAEYFVERAHRIAESLEMGVASVNGVMLGRGQRYRNPALDAPKGGGPA
ncbi:group III truncated hemoglobin [Futiania mangrovi]|uniref:Group III truncated hemoglobin n=1 Tax=Futiania mangrovi TaxID=2959716 RepID=A0A9J6PGG9_9PROT|nr:group III truncated hemoglobin [Futiania mangrovii]MCP1336899.1 group III truncated hemoglobin [Futiania mangrovii]